MSPLLATSDAAEFLALPTISEVRAQKEQEQTQGTVPAQ